MKKAYRERTGAFFSPPIWVELSQRYLADALGENWQDEYYIWDCAAGTGNLLAGLTNRYHIWASTLDRQDVEVIKDRIRNGANLLEEHVFQFDFLNDDFSKLPKNLQAVINDPEKRKKLVVYINPPYAEATSTQTVARTGKNKAGVSKGSRSSEYYSEQIGSAANEMFALFMTRIYDKIPGCTLGMFAKMKFVQGSNFARFKDFFLARYLGGFVVPAATFYNVKGRFPIGFTMWDLSQSEKMTSVACDVFASDGASIGVKEFYGDLPASINKWLTNFYIRNGESVVGILSTRGNDFQNQKYIYLAARIDNDTHDTKVKICQYNLLPLAVYFTVRHCIQATWLNDRDQFLYPNNSWETDTEFQNDCLAFALFHGQNRISAQQGTNYWIPFTEQEVNAKEKFVSNFMTDFIAGKLRSESNGNLFQPEKHRTTPLAFSAEARAVFEAGRQLWRYYHENIRQIPDWAGSGAGSNASLYDIREYFQGRNEAGKMNNKSPDERYNALMANLRDALDALAEKIEPKVYEYGFLKR